MCVCLSCCPWEKARVCVSVFVCVCDFSRELFRLVKIFHQLEPNKYIARVFELCFSFAFRSVSVPEIASCYVALDKMAKIKLKKTFPKWKTVSLYAFALQVSAWQYISMYICMRAFVRPSFIYSNTAVFGTGEKKYTQNNRQVCYSYMSQLCDDYTKLSPITCV